ncbi:UvrD-helicase domain-containing protein [Noviherbaspirillum pedocola]|uniref:DNA 3'-5' helicase n=1 Tax=Noviherbaspirillum pedocola TaxID=2801341 RepID=A0A934W9C0_9BURK|nr:UvrD-helicase domain-containing protein [Noviherbaspirillum pedocola]MBK4738670.1 ATP-dependent helicase [Noviherbaspirillum pedocola]
MDFTHEQAGIIHSQARHVTVRAFAGAGKTTTLRGYAALRPRSRILYLAFNKAMATEAAASFPANVDCRTIHSLAYAAVGHAFRHKIGALRAIDITQLYADVPLIVATMLERTLSNFMYSASPTVGVEHAPEHLAFSDRQQLGAAAQHVWRDMIDPATAVPLPHDGYLKLYQLSGPVLSRRYDIILLDEAQDTNPVTADIVFQQACAKVLVGDRHQSIYGFRGNVDVMGMLAGAEPHYLTHSMRFGDDIAAAATNLLRYMKGEDQTIVGKPGMAPNVGRVNDAKPFAIISRTNAGVFKQAIRLMRDRRVHFIGDMHTTLLGKLSDLHGLWAEETDRIQDPFFRQFADFEAVSRYGRETGDKEVLSLAGVVSQYGAKLPELMTEVAARACPQPEQADVLLLTAHRSKGLQFDQVMLDDDFQDLVDKKGHRLIDPSPEFEQEINLTYVAMTRARQTLQVNLQYRAFANALASGTLLSPP